MLAIVLPGEARNLLVANGPEKADSSGKPGPRNDPRNDKFRCFSANCKVRASTYQRAVKLGPDAAQILGAEARGRTVGYVGAEATTHKLRSFSAGRETAL